MQTILDNISSTQIVFGIIGLILIFVSIKDKILSLMNTKNGTIDITIDSETDLTNIVAKWEILSDACKEAGLSDAYKKLQEVFPMLVGIYKNKEIVHEKE